MSRNPCQHFNSFLGGMYMSAQYLLTEELISIKEMVRQIAQKDLAPVDKECY